MFKGGNKEWHTHRVYKVHHCWFIVPRLYTNDLPLLHSSITGNNVTNVSSRNEEWTNVIHDLKYFENKQACDQSKYKWNLCTWVNHVSHYLSSWSLFRTVHSPSGASQTRARIWITQRTHYKTDSWAPPSELLIQQFGGEVQETTL